MEHRASGELQEGGWWGDTEQPHTGGTAGKAVLLLLSPSHTHTHSVHTYLCALSSQDAEVRVLVSAGVGSLFLPINATE